MTFNVVMFILIELLWSWFAKERVKREKGEEEEEKDKEIE